MRKKKTNRVDFSTNSIDFETVLLGSLGYSSLYIQKQTGYSIGQIQYRLSKLRVRRSDYRNGHSKLAKFVLTVSSEEASRLLNGKIKGG